MVVLSIVITLLGQSPMHFQDRLNGLWLKLCIWLKSVVLIHADCSLLKHVITIQLCSWILYVWCVRGAE